MASSQIRAPAFSTVRIGRFFSMPHHTRILAPLEGIQGGVRNQVSHGLIQQECAAGHDDLRHQLGRKALRPMQQVTVHGQSPLGHFVQPPLQLSDFILAMFTAFSIKIQIRHLFSNAAEADDRSGNTAGIDPGAEEGECQQPWGGLASGPMPVPPGFSLLPAA